MSVLKKRFAAMLCVAILMLCVTPVVADMLILPMRVYFKDGERMKSLTVLNNGGSQAIYRLAFVHNKQQPDGSYVEMPQTITPGYDPSEWLVYSPRQVDLMPQAKQSIKISLRRPADMPDGEYRVHAVMRRVARDIIENRGSDAVSGKMMINVGFAVPVVVRKGRYDTTATFESFKLLPPETKGGVARSRAEVTLLRKGKFSSVGRIEGFWTPPGGGEEVEVIKKRSMVIYPEVGERKAVIALDRVIQGGTLRLVYRGMEADRGVVFDEKTYPLQ